jgi:hypothetical protein
VQSVGQQNVAEKLRGFPKQKNVPTGPDLSPAREETVQKSVEGFNRGLLVVFDVENRVQLGDLQQIVNFLGQVEQLQLATLVAYRGESANQFADPGAIDVVHIAQIKQDPLLALRQQILNGIFQNYTALAQGDAPAAIHDRDAIHLTSTGLHGHWEASLRSAESPGTFLMSLISVPVCAG